VVVGSAASQRRSGCLLVVRHAGKVTQMAVKRSSVPHNLLEIHELAVSYASNRRRHRSLDGVSLEIHTGEIYGLVGESGSGKTTLALSILGLIEPPGRIEAGEVIFDGQSLASLTERQLDRLRGAQIGMIFQNALVSLNPTFSIGEQIVEVLRLHLRLSRPIAARKAAEWLARVGLPGLEQTYPHQLSGGQAQRAMIALTLAPGPRLLIADEPTSALDVTVQSQILQLISSLTGPADTTVLLITHDLGILAQFATRVGVLYDGRIVEQQPVEQLFANPQHDYTQRLIQSVRNPELWPGGRG